jgi:hypothetical protein
MSNDLLYALVVLVVFVSVVVRKEFLTTTLELLLSLGRPGATIVILGFILFVYSSGFPYTAMALKLIALVLLKDIWTHWIRSDKRRLMLEVGRDQSRFDEATSLDIQWGSGSADHEKPSMLRVDKDVSPLLLFPPSDQTLREMNG